MAVFDENARMLARYPQPPQEVFGRSFAFRDYYRCIRSRVSELEAGARPGALRPLEGRTCLSPAYRGEISDIVEFTASAPIFDADQQWVGFVLMSRHAKRTLGDIEIGDPYGSGQATTLFGWRGRDRGDPRPNDMPVLTVVAHPELFNTEEYALPRALSDRLIAHFGMLGNPYRSRAPRALRWEEPDYFDPVDRTSKVAGFAPVGATGYVVGVATPLSRALGPNQRHIDSLVGAMTLLNLGFLLVALVAVGATLRERRVPSSH
jgi:hypothetical protein